MSDFYMSSKTVPLVFDVIYFCERTLSGIFLFRLVTGFYIWPLSLQIFPSSFWSMSYL